jgi:NADH-quinone oxidoreductase subunit E
MSVATSSPTAEQRILTDDMVAEIKAYFPRYPLRQAVTLPALHIVHERLRQVPLQAVVEIAELLELPPAVVQDTLTFYGYFHQAVPHGRTRVMVCRSISCALRGADQLLDDMAHELHVPVGETTPDGAVTLEYAECLGACEFAPCLLANKELHGDVDLEKAKGLIGKWKRGNDQ